MIVAIGDYRERLKVVVAIVAETIIVAGRS
jgi:hypothetical protein